MPTYTTSNHWYKKIKRQSYVTRKVQQASGHKILLRSCFFIHILTPAKIFSLQTQNSNISIIDIVYCVDNTKQNYKKLLERFESHKNNLFILLSKLKSVIKKIEHNEDGELEYQG